MKMKFITAVLAFSVAFGFAAFLTTLLGANKQLHFQPIENNSTADHITAFIQQDIDNGQELETVCLFSCSLSEYSDTVSEYTDASQAMEDVNLPPDFRFAWQAHMNAWRKHADFLESSVAGKDFYEEENLSVYKIQRDDIQRTWTNVLNIGKKYNAIIPANAY